MLLGLSDVVIQVEVSYMLWVQPCQKYIGMARCCSMSFLQREQTVSFDADQRIIFFSTENTNTHTAHTPK